MIRVYHKNISIVQNRSFGRFFSRLIIRFTIRVFVQFPSTVRLFRDDEDDDDDET
jgi:hypothetical protein